MKSIHKIAAIGAMIVAAGALMIAVRRSDETKKRSATKHKPVERHAHRPRRVANADV